MNVEPSRRRHMSVLAAVGVDGGTYEEILARTTTRMSEQTFAFTVQSLREQGVLTRDADGKYTRDMARWLKNRKAT